LQPYCIIVVVTSISRLQAFANVLLISPLSIFPFLQTGVLNWLLSSCTALSVEGNCGTIQEGKVASTDGQKQVSAARRPFSCAVLISCQVTLPAFISAMW